jgi:putrescine aminotransferase
MPMAPAGYLVGVEKLCRDRGAKLILDEVQTGLGRTGSLWYALRERLEPDALVTGKGLGGGLYPMAAVLLAPELAEIYHRHPFIHVATFGGAEIGCAVSLAVLDIVEGEGFMERVAALSDRFATAFEPLDLGIRRCGLMMGLAFDDEARAMAAAAALFEAGVFVVWANNDRSVLQFLPPLVLTDDETGELIERVTGTLG